MPFLDRLRLEKVNGQWRLLHELRYDSARLNARLVVPAGFVTDLASVPRLPFAFWFTGDTAHAPTVVHDFLYGTRMVPRAVADAIFAEAMVDIGEPAWRRGLMWAAVRLFGWRAWARSSSHL